MLKPIDPSMTESYHTIQYKFTEQQALNECFAIMENPEDELSPSLADDIVFLIEKLDRYAINVEKLNSDLCLALEFRHYEDELECIEQLMVYWKANIYAHFIEEETGECGLDFTKNGQECTLYGDAAIEKATTEYGMKLE